MARIEQSVKSIARSVRNSEYSNLVCSDVPISSFDLLAPYHSSTRNPSAMSAAAALILQAASDNRIDDSQPSSQITQPSISSSILKCCSSSSEKNVKQYSQSTCLKHAAVAAAAASRATYASLPHSSSASSSLQAAFAFAMVASSPNTLSALSSGQQTGRNSSVFRPEDIQSRQLNILFPTSNSFDTPEGVKDSIYPNFDHSSLNSLPSTNFLNLSQFNNLSSDLSDSSSLANAILLPANLVTSTGQQIQCHQPATQVSSPVYHQTVGKTKGNFNSVHLTTTLSLPVHPSTVTPIPAEQARFERPDKAITSALLDEGTRKREHRLFKNREAARECRRKKKEYVRCLESRVTVLESQNQQLIDELLKIKTFCYNEHYIIPESTLLIDPLRKALSERCISDGFDCTDLPCSAQLRNTLDADRNNLTLQHYQKSTHMNPPQLATAIDLQRYSASAPHENLRIDVENYINQRPTYFTALTSNVSASTSMKNDDSILVTNIFQGQNPIYETHTIASSLEYGSGIHCKKKMPPRKFPSKMCNFLDSNLPVICGADARKDYSSDHFLRDISSPIPPLNLALKKLYDQRIFSARALKSSVNKIDQSGYFDH